MKSFEKIKELHMKKQGFFLKKEFLRIFQWIEYSKGLR